MGNHKIINSLQLVNHGISTSLVENMKTGVKTLFELSMDEKKQLWQREGDLEGFGQAFIVSEEQKLEWADAFFMITLPPHLRKPHLFNQIPQSFRFSFSLFCHVWMLFFFFLSVIVFVLYYLNDMTS